MRASGRLMGRHRPAVVVPASFAKGICYQLSPSSSTRSRCATSSDCLLHHLNGSLAVFGGIHHKARADVRLELLAHAAAVVLDAEFVAGMTLGRAVFLSYANADHAACGSELDGVGQNVQQYLVESQRA